MIVTYGMRKIKKKRIRSKRQFCGGGLGRLAEKGHRVKFGGGRASVSVGSWRKSKDLLGEEEWAKWGAEGR